MTSAEREWVAWTIVGVVAIAALYGVVAQLVSANMANASKARAIRVEKVRACGTIHDEAIKALCVIQGGAGEARK